jgi:hypothetical protein
MAKTAAAKKAVKAEKPAIHEWTNGGDEVLVLRFSDKDGKAYGGFQHPLTIGETVEAPDWNAQPVCGGGIHGWAWGIGLGEGKEPQWNGAMWQVYAVKAADLVGLIDGGCKCKFKTGRLAFVGDWHGAMQFILPGQMNWAYQVSGGAASNSGDYGAASNSGSRGAASNSGDYGAASNSGEFGAASNSGDYGAASNSGSRGAASNSGYGGAASNSGDYGAASNSGSRGAASTTSPGTAAISTGLNSKAKAAEFGCIALAWWNAAEQRVEMRCSEVGKGRGRLKPDVYYRLDDAGKFVEV